MKTNISPLRLLVAAGFAFAASQSFAEAAADAGTVVETVSESFGGEISHPLLRQLAEAAEEKHFNIFATAMFLLSIVHAFFYGEFLYLSNRIKVSGDHAKNFREVAIRFLRFLSEVEIIFALWLIPLFIGYTYYYGWDSLTHYLDDMAYQKERFAEPVFVLVIMSISATRPIVDFASGAIEHIAKFGGNTVRAWWCCILFVGSLLGSFITEPAAITICAMLLCEHFFKYKPSEKFKYATLGLLLVAISIGGTLTPFAAPPVLMVKKAWNWDFAFMLSTFAWKSALVIAVSILLYGFIFRKEFKKLQERKEAQSGDVELREKSPGWLIACHLAFLVSSILIMHYTVLIVFLFFMFLALLKITMPFQDKFSVENPLLVCIFLASLVIHGSFQGWWIGPVLGSLDEAAVFLGSIVLTSFNDNAAITYLATLAPDFTDSAKYLIVAGAVTGGGLTLIANAPNLAGASILKPHFGNAISPLHLFLGAIIPTSIAALCYFFL